MPFTSSQNSIWFRSYSFRKIDVFDLFFDSDSNENCHAVGTTFNYFSVIVGQPNLVSSFLTSFLRGVLWNILEKSNPPSEKTVEIQQFWRLFGHADGTRFQYFPVIIGQPNLVSTILTSFPRGIFGIFRKNPIPPSEMTVEIQQFWRLFGLQLVHDFTTFLSS